MKKPQVLLLDDDASRLRVFTDRMSKHSLRVETTETVEGCIGHLGDQVWDLVLLDHDLGGEIFVDSVREDTGAEVTRWLRANPAPHGAFIVHSMNPVGAAGMFFDLREMGYRVTQATFGSSEFWQVVYGELGIKGETRRTGSRLGEAFSRYFQSLRARRK